IDSLEGLYGGYWRYDLIDFCFLFNLYFPPKDLYSKLAHEIPFLLNNYPSAQHKIRSLLSTWYTDEGFTKENILVGNGASEFIRIFNRQFIKKITIPVPSFNEYEDLDASQINYLDLNEKDNFILDADRFIESANKSNSNFAVVINPNNPTSTVTKREDIIKILENLKHLEGIIVDESFIDFTGERENYSLQSYTSQFSNLVVLRSLSKEFGVPGLRLGYIVSSNEQIKKKIKRYLPIWNINSIAERFIELFPRYQREYNQSIKQIIEDNENFRRDLASIRNIKVIDGKANYLFCKILNEKVNSTQLRSILFSKYSILIKDCSNKTSLNDRHIRISVRKPPENKMLVDALKKVLA
ncbi:MAG: pyridoxal phosphate-dependent aminotransferase, partial [Elusimicrobiota bacterium]